MSVPELVRLGVNSLPAVTPLPEFLDECAQKKHCVLVTSAFWRLRNTLKGTAEVRGISVLDAVDGSNVSKNWLSLGQDLQDVTAVQEKPVLVLLDEPKALFEGADRMSQGLQIAIEELQKTGWTCGWYAIRDLQNAPLAQAYQRMAEWLARGVPLSSDLLAFCSLDCGDSPDEHALDAMGSKGDWKNRFGRVRLTASRAILASIREVLDDGDAVNSALVAISVRADDLDPRKLSPDESGWGHKDFDKGWRKARATEAALLRLRESGRLPPAARSRIDTMLSPNSALAILVGLRTGREIGFAKACSSFRRCEEILRVCRNVLEHSKGAPEGSYQLVGAVLVAAEAWESKIRVTLQSNLQFPDDWDGWREWSEVDLQKAARSLQAVFPRANGGLVQTLALIDERSVTQVEPKLSEAGGGLARLVKGRYLSRLAKDCKAIAGRC